MHGGLVLVHVVVLYASCNVISVLQLMNLGFSLSFHEFYVQLDLRIKLIRLLYFLWLIYYINIGFSE